MRIHKFIPELCKGENPKFSGSINIRIPSVIERYKYMDLIGADGLSVLHEDAPAGDDPEAMKKRVITNIRKANEVSKLFGPLEKHIDSVEIVKVEDGTKYSTFEDLGYDQDCDAMLFEAASFLMNGFKTSKN